MNKNTDLLKQAFSYHKSGNVSKAKKLYEKVIKTHKHPFAFNNLATIYRAEGNIDKAKRLYKKAITLDPQYIEPINNLGNIYLEYDQYDKAITQLKRACAINPHYTNAIYNLALTYKKKGDFEKSFSLLKSIEVDKKSVDIDIHLALIMIEKGDATDAIDILNNISNRCINYPFYYLTLTKAFYKNQQFKECRDVFVNALEHINSQSLFMAYINLLINRGDTEKAIEKLNPPNDAVEFMKLAEVYENIGDSEKIIDTYQKGVAKHPLSRPLLYNFSVYLRSNDRIKDAIEVLNNIYIADRSDAKILSEIVYLKQKSFDLNDLSKKRKTLFKLLNSEYTGYPDPRTLMMLFDDEDVIYSATEKYSSRIPAKERIFDYTCDNNKQKTIGFVSYDFRSHPLSYLLEGLFSDLKKYDLHLIAFSLSPEDKNDNQQKIMKGIFDEFIFIDNLNAYESAHLINKNNIDILFDLGGYTYGAKPEIFSYRPSPIQIHYMGYAGTMMSEHYDHMISDEIVSKADSRKTYKEKVIDIPTGYWYSTPPNIDLYKNQESIDSAKKKHKLPLNKFIFCCFNSTDKVTNDVFTAWINILKHCKESVFWIYCDSEKTKENILLHFSKNDISYDRIIFAAKVTHSEHLQRIQLANLFLDTSPYNAHTTCSDALYMKLPVISLKGNTLHARVSNSILKQFNINECSVKNSDEYIKLACELYQNTDKYIALRNKISISHKHNNEFSSSLYNYFQLYVSN